MMEHLPSRAEQAKLANAITGSQRPFFCTIAAAATGEPRTRPPHVARRSSRLDHLLGAVVAIGLLR
jgi:hypothetical protein